MARKADITRNTKETQIRLSIDLDGKGEAKVSSGVGFFDHMLESFARHGFFDLTLECKGDLNVDAHHTIEDVGIVLGNAIREALGEKKGIKRYGHFTLPMDETLILCATDLCGRPYLGFDLKFTNEMIGDMPTEMVKEFFYAVSYSAGMNIHIRQLAGENNHHICEAAFKSFAKALDMAVSAEERCADVLSTKGSL